MVLLALAGCTQILGVKDITLGDAGSGSGTDAANLACITDPTITLFHPCFVALPTNDATLQGTIDTDVCAMGTKQSQGPGMPEVCVIAGKTVMVNAPLRANGSRPLVIAAVTDITVSSMIDIAGGASLPAAGANPLQCSGTTPGGAATNGGGGGGGGAFAASSGGGGIGFGTGGTQGNGTGAAAKLMFVRGGCSGGAGGDGGAGTGGTAGTAGGALYLVAGNSVDVSSGATIAAAGGGGGGGGMDSANGGGGGGGGASGGLIAIEAPTLGINGVLYANAGGGGGAGSFSGAGQPGQRGTLSTAAGGAGAGATAGNGASGGVDTMAAAVGGNGFSNGGGGGGGGGSIGIVWLNYMFADTSGSSISPAESGP